MSRPRPAQRRERSFTLVELLVVVTVIGLLALLATVNYEALLVKAKVAQVQIEHHFVATGLEFHHADNFAYPFERPPSQHGAFATVSLTALTTPITYIPTGGVLLDPFAEHLPSDLSLPGLRHGNPYLYANYEQFASYRMAPWNGGTPFRGWALTSIGPDGIHEDMLLIPSAATLGPAYFRKPTASLFVYDPTNGTTSRGGIIKLGGWVPAEAAFLLRP